MKKLPSSVQTSLLTVLFTFFFLYIFARLFGPIPFSVNSITTMKSDLFTVSGEGESTAVPDTALVNLGITDNANDVEQAKTNVTEKANKIIAALKSLGIDEKHIKTTNYSVNPNYDYSNGRDKITGYSVSQNVAVEVKPIERANKAVDLATQNGANMVGNIQFTLNDEEKDRVEMQARENAIKKAKEKASSIANASGIRLGKLINVSETSDRPNPPMLYNKMSMQVGGKGAADESTNLQPGENSIHVTVTLSYETL